MDDGARRFHCVAVEIRDFESLVNAVGTTRLRVMLGSGEETLMGREALSKSVAAMIADPAFKDDWVWERVDLSADGRLAYLLRTTTMTSSDAAGAPVASRARLGNVRRKDADGIWRCVVDVWVDDPKAVAPPVSTGGPR